MGSQADTSEWSSVGSQADAFYWQPTVFPRQGSGLQWVPAYTATGLQKVLVLAISFQWVPAFAPVVRLQRVPAFAPTTNLLRVSAIAPTIDCLRVSAFVFCASFQSVPTFAPIVGLLRVPVFAPAVTLLRAFASTLPASFGFCTCVFGTSWSWCWCLCDIPLEFLVFTRVSQTPILVCGMYYILISVFSMFSLNFSVDLRLGIFFFFW